MRREADAGKNCVACGSLCSSSSDFCPSCGTLFPSATGVFCSKHGSRPARAVCVVCQAPFCAECCKLIDGRALCSSHAGVKIEQDFAMVYSSTDIKDAELAKAILDSRGFHVVVRDFTPIGYVWDGAGDTALSRSLLRKQAKVFVPILDYERALIVLNEWSTGREVSTDDDEW